MKHTLSEALKNRRTYYSINSTSPISHSQIEQIIKQTILHTPSAFNSQSTRIAVLFNENHKKLWQIVLERLRTVVAPDNFAATEQKINSFAAAHATILYFEDQDVIEKMQQKFPAYTDNFPVWSAQTAGMHQLAIWTQLEDAGLGASIQHYNPLIDSQVTQTWNLPQSWRLVAQMPFGTPTAEPNEKTFLPIEQRVVFFE